MSLLTSKYLLLIVVFCVILLFATLRTLSVNKKPALEMRKPAPRPPKTPSPTPVYDPDLSYVKHGPVNRIRNVPTGHSRSMDDGVVRIYYPEVCIMVSREGKFLGWQIVRELDEVVD